MPSDKVKKKIDRILGFVQERLGEEVGSLMGATLTLSDMQTGLINKEDFFDQPAGKMVFSEMELSGEIEGKGGLLISVRDAIRLGGTLIMLPDNELDESVVTEDYTEEIDDSYGEIANLIAGAYTSTFEEMYPKSFRFIRKTSEIIMPMKVDIESDHPLPNQSYYQVSVAMALNDTEMGQLVLLMPSDAFGLGEVPVSADEPVKKESPVKAEVEEATASREEEKQVAEETSAPATKPFDLKKQKKRVDACLAECRARMEVEVGALLGVEVKLSDHKVDLISKEDFFMDEAAGKVVLAHMDIVGELKGNNYLSVSLADAIRIGGTLIMLPPDELDTVVMDGDFSSDCEDAYGEIANIISGVYTKVFEEQYPKKIRFVKTHLEEVISMKVDAQSDDPMSDILYYMASANIDIGDHELGKMHMLLPADVFMLEGLAENQSADDGQEDVSRSKGSVTGTSGSQAQVVGAAQVASGDDTTNNPEFLIISNDAIECEKFTSLLDQRETAYTVLDYKENVSNYLPGNVRALFLVMAEVDEKGLGVAIKLSAASSLPLVAAGPRWTRTKVIKAVKYGVDDILLTPASDSDIIEKFDSLQAEKAA